MKRYSSYIKENTDILSKSPEEIIKYVGGDVAGFNSYDDAVEEIEYVINADFPYGLKNIPDKIILYRFLLLEDEEKINEEEIGEHFTAEQFIDRGFLEKIGVWDNWSDEAKLWLLTCETDKEYIDLDKTLANRLSYPRENEITLFDNANIKILKRTNIKKTDVGY